MVIFLIVYSYIKNVCVNFQYSVISSFWVTHYFWNYKTYRQTTIAPKDCNINCGSLPCPNPNVQEIPPKTPCMYNKFIVLIPLCYSNLERLIDLSEFEPSFNINTEKTPQTTNILISHGCHTPQAVFNNIS